jgi:hypothetical protein
VNALRSQRFNFTPAFAGVRLVNVWNLPVFEGHFHVFVDVDLFGAKIDLHVRLAWGAFHPGCHR